MNNLMLYNLKAGIGLSVLYLVYWVFLRKDTSFRFNRFLLTGSVLLAMVLPLMADLWMFRPAALQQMTLFQPLRYNINPVSPALPVSPKTGHQGPGYVTVINLIYLAGLLVVLSRLLYQAIFLHALTRLSGKSDYRGYSIYRMTAGTMPFSYFRRIFIPTDRYDDEALEHIVAHEQSHRKQGHFLDLLVVEIVTVLQWFNPFVWLFEKAIKETHEYLADEDVIKANTNTGRYQALMVNQALGGPVFLLSNQFNQSLIKKRIMMMRKMKTPPWAKLKALMFLPVIAGLAVAFAGKPASSSAVSQAEITVTGQLSDKVTGSVLPGAIVVIKGTTSGTVADRQGHFTIRTPDNAMLVFSMVGYKTQELSVRKDQVINVLMEQDALVVDLDKQETHEEAVDIEQGTVAATNEKGTYVFTEELPYYEGGTEALVKFLSANMKYPEEARKAGIEGKVYVNFIVDAEGRVSHAKVIRSASPSLNAEAIRLVELMTQWNPARQQGEPLSMGVTLPIEFRSK